MRSLLLIAAAAVSMVAVNVQAGELDNERAITNEQIQMAQALPKTVVVRVNEATKEVEVMHTDKKIAADQSSIEEVVGAKFIKMDVKGQMRGELDRDSSSSSWFFCFNNYNWYYPTYYYNNYSYYYQPYYNYSYGGYNYYYSSWSYYGGGYNGGYYNGWY